MKEIKSKCNLVGEKGLGIPFLIRTFWVDMIILLNTERTYTLKEEFQNRPSLLS